MRWLLVVLWLGCCLQRTWAANILALCVVPSPSHSLWCYKYLATLADRGHQITVLGVDEPKIKIPNITTFVANEVYKAVIFDAAQLSWYNLYDQRLAMMTDFKHYNQIATKAILESKALSNLLNRYEGVAKPFDLIVHDNCVGEALLGLVPTFGNPPILFMTAWGSPQWMTLRAGNTYNPAYVPSMLSEPTQHMDFYQRFKNTFYYVYLEWFYNFITFPYQDKMMRARFGEHLPPVRDIARRANIILVSYNFVFDGPRPQLPGTIGVAGLHISEPKPLPQDIKEFMDGAKEGAVVVSFGTNVVSGWLPDDVEGIIITAFKQLPQRFLWKWDKDVANLPANVRVSKWLPQGDMLVHPNMRLLITHCGLASTLETIVHKVPFLSLPVFFDQFDIAGAMVKRNLTIQLNIRDLSSDSLRDSIKELLSNPMYKRNIEKMGALMKDAPLTPTQNAVFWTEYALRHSGAPHLRSAAVDMPWYQLLLLDVLGTLTLAILVVVWFVRSIASFLIRRLLGLKPKTKSD